MASTRLGYLAVKKETTRGTVVKPTNFIRFKDGSISYDQEIIENNPIQNVRWNALNAVPGKIATDGSYSLDADMRDIGYFLMAGLGTYAQQVLDLVHIVIHSILQTSFHRYHLSNFKVIRLVLIM